MLMPDRRTYHSSESPDISKLVTSQPKEVSTKIKSPVSSVPSQSNNRTAGQSLTHALPFLKGVEQYPQFQRVNYYYTLYAPHLRPWNEFVDRNRLSKPKDFNDGMARVNHNIIQYRINYILILSGFLVITNLWLLFTVLFVIASVWKISQLPPGQTLKLLGQSVTQQQLYLAVGLASLPLFYFSAFGSSIFWVIGISAVVILFHASSLEKSVETDFADSV